MRQLKNVLKMIWPFAIPLAALTYWIADGHIRTTYYLDLYSIMSKSERIEASLLAGTLICILWIGIVMSLGTFRTKRSMSVKMKLTEEKVSEIAKTTPRSLIPSYVRLCKRYPEEYVKWVMTHFTMTSKYRDIKALASEKHEGWAERPVTDYDKSLHIACHVLVMHLLGGTTISVSTKLFGTQSEFQYVLPGNLSLEDTLWVETVSLISPIAFVGSAQKSLIHMDALKTSSLALQLSAIGKSPSYLNIDTDVNSVLKASRESARKMIMNHESGLKALTEAIKNKKTLNAQQVKKALVDSGFNI